jgi:hypothetical protein
LRLTGSKPNAFKARFCGMRSGPGTPSPLARFASGRQPQMAGTVDPRPDAAPRRHEPHKPREAWTLVVAALMLLALAGLAVFAAYGVFRG